MRMFKEVGHRLFERDPETARVRVRRYGGVDAD
jgi:hypothetical protein